MPLLKAEHISKSYNKTGDEIKVLKNLDITVSKGEILVLMGPSGSGKSTLLNILGTLDRDFSGNLIIDDISITSSTDLAKLRCEKLGFVFQFHHLLPEFTIYENLIIPKMIAENHSNNDNTDIFEMVNLYGRGTNIIQIDHYHEIIIHKGRIYFF